MGRRLSALLESVLAFLVIVVCGLAAGCVLFAADAIEEQLIVTKRRLLGSERTRDDRLR